jgi:hypothetical protein
VPGFNLKEKQGREQKENTKGAKEKKPTHYYWRKEEMRSKEDIDSHRSAEEQDEKGKCINKRRCRI